MLIKKFYGSQGQNDYRRGQIGFDRKVIARNDFIGYLGTFRFI